MSTRLYTHQYDNQIEKFTSQVMRALSGFQVKSAGVTRDGVDPTLERVNVAFGAPSRIVSAISSSESRFVNHRVPMIGAMLSGVMLNSEAPASFQHTDSISYVNSDSMVNTVERKIGPGLTLSYGVDIYASSMTQLFEIMEQVILAFHNGIKIQKSNDLFDANYRSTLVLESINNNINYPLGPNKRLVQTTLEFSMDIRLSYPKAVQDQYIREIEVKMFEQDSGELVETVFADDDDSVVESFENNDFTIE